MSKVTYPSLFSRYRVNYPSNIFRNTRSLENWGISLGYAPVLAGAYSGAFRPIAHERKYLMDYKLGYVCLAQLVFVTQFSSMVIIRSKWHRCSYWRIAC